MGFEAVAIIAPKPGKEERVLDGLKQLAQKTQETEPECSRYQVYEQTNHKGTVEYVVVEEYTSKAAFDAHISTDEFKGLGEIIKQEDLLAKPLDIKTVNRVSGFFSR